MASENEYEAQRASRIAANKQRLEALGVVEAAQQLQKQHTKKPLKWRPPSSNKAPAAAPRPAPVVLTRASKRLRGESSAQPAAAAQDDQRAGPSSSGKAAKSAGRSSNPNEPRFELTATQYATPFTLMSIGVTVHDLGCIWRGPFSSNYYSNKSCLYRHAYPVGYRASKEVFGHTWDMEITAGDAGPVFTVSQRGGARSFSGTTPTRPWTDVCLAFRTGQRISGPLHYGFSDLHVQRALAAMYNPAELTYALYGTPLTAGPAPAATALPQPEQQPQPQEQPQQQALFAAEAFAAQLKTIQGIGAATAQVLALTTALGGARHSSLESLQAWLRADPQHAETLQHYLLTSDEVPRCSRQLPSWRGKWVPLIMQQLA